MKKFLTLNAGSSSIKFAVFNAKESILDTDPEFRGQISGIDSEPVLKVSVRNSGKMLDAVWPSGVRNLESAWPFVLDWIEDRLNRAPLSAIGHRVVHGGANFSEPVYINTDIMVALQELSGLAPRHQPYNLIGISAAKAKWPKAKQIACFDTVFHRTQPRVEQIFALPRRLCDEGVSRYGFHGLSYEYIQRVAPSILGALPNKKIIVAHLGAGASMCAMKEGNSVATTMGFTALDGLPMATRCGSLDPGVVLHLIKDKHMSPDEVTDCLYAKSGLLGVSNISGDMRQLVKSNDPCAAEAIDLFVHRAAREIGSLTAAMGGLDALIFTAGIGENSPIIRERILAASEWLGFKIDCVANEAGDKKISKGQTLPSAWVMQTNEELMIVDHTHKLFTEYE